MITPDDIVIGMCGSRTWRDAAIVDQEVQRLQHRYDTRLLIRHGDEPNGADERIWEACEAHEVRHMQYCAARPRHTPHATFWLVWVADWEIDGRAAGPIRNKAMRDAGMIGLVAFRMPGKSIGTDGMCALARERFIPVIVRSVEGSCAD